MKRLCIYMTYNSENKIYEYIGKVLQALRTCCSKVFLVCNYQRAASGLEYAQPYVDEIFYRKNKGYDAGAFKDILCDILGWNEIDRYDELVLVNDSFFGFFYPLKDTFDLMNQENCDFWGMTGQESGEWINPLYKFDAHVHSYFMVFHKKIIQSRVFREYWENLKYPLNFREAIIYFEIGINICLRKHGFTGKSFIDVYNIQLERNENPSYSMLCKLVKNYKFPVMKKKCVLIRNAGFSDTLKILDYLSKEDRYPIEWIIQYMENQFYISGMGDAPCNSLELFYNNHSDVYIYGAGVCGRNLAVYFKHRGWRHKGFIVSEKAEQDTDCILLDDAQINAHTGIIVSVIRKEVSDEIVKYIQTKSNCKREQLFLIYDCKALRLPE